MHVPDLHLTDESPADMGRGATICIDGPDADARASTGTLAGILADALHRQRQALLVADAQGVVLFANRRAEELIAGQHGIMVRGGVLQTLRLCETLSLRQAIASCACRATPAPGDRFLSVSQAGGRPPLAVAILSLPHHPAALVAITDPERCGVPSPQQLQAYYGLTAAEAALAVEVIAGDGLHACARRLGISRNTASTHLRHIFEKTATSRQAELVRVLLTIGTDCAH